MSVVLENSFTIKDIEKIDKEIKMIPLTFDLVFKNLFENNEFALKCNIYYNKYGDNKMKKTIWKILLIAGIIPFAAVLFVGIYDSIVGFGGLCFFSCELDYGFKAFIGSIYLWSYLMWPTYIIGCLLIILSIIKLKKIKG